MSYYKVVIFSNFYSRKSIKNRKKTRLENLVLIIIPAAGVEPARCCHRWILSSILAFFKYQSIDLTDFWNFWFSQKGDFFQNLVPF